MKRKISLAFLVLAVTSSCVSKKIYTDLENKFADLKKENRQLQDDNEACTKAKNQLDLDLAALKSEHDKVKSERDKYLTDYTAADKNLKTLQASYAALEKNSDEALQNNMAKNRELLAQLEAKGKHWRPNKNVWIN
jgi:chemotaxis protein MotB